MPDNSRVCGYPPRDGVPYCRFLKSGTATSRAGIKDRQSVRNDSRTFIKKFRHRHSTKCIKRGRTPLKMHRTDSPASIKVSVENGYLINFSGDGSAFWARSLIGNCRYFNGKNILKSAGREEP